MRVGGMADTREDLDNFSFPPALSSCGFRICNEEQESVKGHAALGGSGDNNVTLLIYGVFIT